MYLVDLLKGEVPAPEPAFPAISLPNHLSRGAPPPRKLPSGKAANAAMKAAVTPRIVVEGDDDEEDEGSMVMSDPKSQEDFIKMVQSVEPGSDEAIEVVKKLCSKVKSYATWQKLSGPSVMKNIAIPLWRERQGKHQSFALVSGKNLNFVFSLWQLLSPHLMRRTVSGPYSAKSTMFFNTFGFCFNLEGFSTMVDRQLVINRALGRDRTDAYRPFQIHGFPNGFEYPPKADDLKLANPLQKGLEHCIAFAVIKECLEGTVKDGERSFFRFVPVEWGE